jgi:hypothetical protein
MRHRIHGCVHQDGGQQALAASVQQAVPVPAPQVNPWGMRQPKQQRSGANPGCRRVKEGRKPF